MKSDKREDVVAIALCDISDRELSDCLVDTNCKGSCGQRADYCMWALWEEASGLIAPVIKAHKEKKILRLDIDDYDENIIAKRLLDTGIIKVSNEKDAKIGRTKKSQQEFALTKRGEYLVEFHAASEKVERIKCDACGKTNSRLKDEGETPCVCSGCGHRIR